MKRVLMLIGLLVLIFAPVLAQDVEPPGDWLELLGNMDVWFGTLAGFAAVTVFLSGLVNKLFKISVSWAKQVVAWLVAILLCFIGNLINFGLLAEATWLQTLVYGLGAGLIANGIFDVAVVRLILQYLKLDVKKPE
jgi:hypothetical protein